MGRRKLDQDRDFPPNGPGVLVFFPPYVLAKWVTESSTKTETVLRATSAVFFLCCFAYGVWSLPLYALLALAGYSWATSKLSFLGGYLGGFAALLFSWHLVVEPHLSRRVRKAILTFFALSVVGFLVCLFAHPAAFPADDTFLGHSFQGLYGGLLTISAGSLARAYRSWKGRRGQESGVR